MTMTYGRSETNATARGMSLEEYLTYDDGTDTCYEQERRSLALKMLQEGATVEFVTKVTGFSVAQIQAR
jgi:hypothetical protein